MVGWVAGCLTSRLAGSVQCGWLVLRLISYFAGWAGYVLAVRFYGYVAGSNYEAARPRG